MSLKKTAVLIFFTFILAECLCFFSSVCGQSVVIEGKVKTLEGEEVPRLSLEIEHAVRGGRKTKSDKKGNFKIRVFETGKYQIRPLSEEYALYSTKLTVKSASGITLLEQRLPVEADGKSPLFEVKTSQDIYLILTVVEKGKEKSSGFSLAAEKDKTSYLLEIQELIQSEEFEKAEIKLKDILKKSPENAAAHYLMGVMEYEKSRNAQAESHFRKAAEIDSDIQGAWFYLGKIAYENNELDRALHAFKSEAHVSKEWPDIYRNLAAIYKKKGMKEELIDVLDHLILLTPEDDEAYEELIALYSESGEAEKAEELLKTRESMGEKEPAVYYNLGVNYFREEKFEKAATAFNITLEKKPQMSEAHKAIAYCYLKMKKNKQALPHLKTYLQLEPKAEDKEKIQEFIKAIESSQ